jgi:hypothetical protein
MAQKGLFRDAVEVATLALAVLPEGARSPVLEQRIARYKREGGSNAGSLVEEKKPAPRKAQ